jgi:hypothetical protein
MGVLLLYGRALADSTLGLMVPAAATSVRIENVDIVFDNETTVARYSLDAPERVTLTVSFPLYADPRDESGTYSPGKLILDGKPVAAKLRGDKLVATLSLEAQHHTLEHRLRPTAIECEAPSAVGNVACRAEWSTHGAKLWRGDVPVHWRVTVDEPNHCLASRQAGARLDGKTVAWQGVASGQPLVVVWEPSQHVDEVARMRGDHSDELHAINETSSLSDYASEKLVEIYNDTLGEYDARFGPGEDRERMCQEITVGAFLKSMHGLHWLGARAAPRKTLRLYSTADQLRKIAAELDRRKVKHAPLPPAR